MKFFWNNKNSNQIIYNKDLNKTNKVKNHKAKNHKVKDHIAKNQKAVDHMSKDIKYLSIKCFAIGLILCGIIFTSINIVKFAKGYFASESKNNQIQSINTVTQKNSDNNETNNSDDLLSATTKELIEQKKKEKEQAQSLYKAEPKVGEQIGELYIPKLDSTLPIFHGTNEDELVKGVGHYADSVLPGEKDNCVLAGHRDTVFRKLGDVSEGDKLIVTTSVGEFEYTVYKVRIVDKDDRTVIVPKPKATLTVSTCYPFQYIGSAPKRYVLIAYLSSKKLY